MAKCPICNSRKGKRKCLTAAGEICTLCCGKTRKEDACQGCTFYSPPKESRRKYTEVPRYTPAQMNADWDLQEHSNAIEGAVCNFDYLTGKKINDDVPIRMYELLLDKYYFKDEAITFGNDVMEQGFHHVDRAIEEDLDNVSNEVLVKILSVLHFVAKRRSQGGREYLQIVNDMVGARIGPGMRMRDL